MIILSLWNTENFKKLPKTASLTPRDIFPLWEYLLRLNLYIRDLSLYIPHKTAHRKASFL